MALGPGVQKNLSVIESYTHLVTFLTPCSGQLYTNVMTITRLSKYYENKEIEQSKLFAYIKQVLFLEYKQLLV